MNNEHHHPQQRLRTMARWLKTWPAIGLMLALALLLAFYAVVASGAKRAEQQRLQDSQRSQAFSRCDNLPVVQRRECQAHVIATPAQAPQRAAAPLVQVAGLPPLPGTPGSSPGHARRPLRFLIRGLETARRVRYSRPHSPITSGLRPRIKERADGEAR